MTARGPALCLALALAGPALAEDAPPLDAGATAAEVPAAEEPPAEPGPLDAIRDAVSGEARYDFYGYFSHGLNDDRLTRNEAILDLDVKPPPAGPFSLVLETRSLVSDAPLEAGVIDERHERRNHFTFRQAYVGALFGPVDVRVGVQQFTWGRSDLYSPEDVDVPSPLDLTDPFSEDGHPPKLGIPAARVSWAAAEWLTFEGIYAPLFVPDRLAPSGQRFDFTSQIEAPLLERDLPSWTITDADAGARATGRAGDVEVGASYYYGRDRASDLRPKLFTDPSGAVAVGLEPFYGRRHVVGLDAGMPISLFTVHADAAYFHHRLADEDRYVQWCTGGTLKKSGFLREDGELSIAMDLTGEVVTERSTAPGQIDGTLSRALDGALLGRASYEVPQPFWWAALLRAQCSASWIWNGEKSYWVEPLLEWRPVDRIRVEVGSDLLGGALDTFFGEFRGDSRIFLRLRFSF